MTKQNLANGEVSGSRCRMDELRRYSEEGAVMIPLKGIFNFTKAASLDVEGVLLRDFEIERSTSAWVTGRVGWEQLLGQFAQLDSSLVGLQLPRHYPTRVLCGNPALASSQDVFLYFPFGANVSSTDDRDVFGFELIETSERIFAQIHAPCMLRAFDDATLAVFHRLLFGRTPEVIYLYALLHELSHRIGPWKVVPSRDPRIGIAGWRLAVMGELAADLTLIHAAKAFPELMVFVFLNRIFWYGRRGWTDDPLHALLNADNDSWGAAWLWQKFEQCGALQYRQDKVGIDLDRLAVACNQCFDEVTSLGHRLVQMNSGEGDALDDWMAEAVPSAGGRFHVPRTLGRIYEYCAEVPETLVARSFKAADSTVIARAGIGPRGAELSATGTD